MRKGQTDVLAAFIAGEHCVKGSISTDGVTILSYAMPIARRGKEGILVLGVKGPSVTTTRHINEVRQALDARGYAFETVSAFVDRLELRF